MSLARWLLAVAVALCACGAQTIDLNKPVYLRVPSMPFDPFPDGPNALAVATNALRSLGATVVDDPSQALDNPTINVLTTTREDSECGGEEGFVGYVNYDYPNTAWICPQARDSAWAWFWVFEHELGHVLGAVHIPCSTQGVMGVTWGCSEPVRGVNPPYNAPDFDTICGNGRTIGGLCGN